MKFVITVEAKGPCLIRLVLASKVSASLNSGKILKYKLLKLRKEIDEPYQPCCISQSDLV